MYKMPKKSCVSRTFNKWLFEINLQIILRICKSIHTWEIRPEHFYYTTKKICKKDCFLKNNRAIINTR